MGWNNKLIDTLTAKCFEKGERINALEKERNELKEALDSAFAEIAMLNNVITELRAKVTELK